VRYCRAITAETVVQKRSHKWKNEQPIYKQLMEEVIAGILDHRYLEGQMLPSVRGLAEAYDVNPLTAAKAYRELQRDGLIETVRGEGLIVKKGVHSVLMKRERAKFIKEEWPDLRARLARMNLDLKTLFAAASD
jgi:GntR family transcriptional regulator